MSVYFYAIEYADGTYLTLPGTIPGLLRRCSPVVGRNLTRLRDYQGVVTGFCGTKSLHKGKEDRFAWVGPVPRPSYSGQGPEIHLKDLALDLTDATGRFHAEEYVKNHESNEGRRLLQEWRRGIMDQPLIKGGLDFFDGDPRLLEDGSRWVDAEALRLVVLHAAGLTVPAT